MPKKSIMKYRPGSYTADVQRERARHRQAAIQLSGGKKKVADTGAQYWNFHAAGVLLDVASDLDLRDAEMRGMDPVEFILHNVRLRLGALGV